MIKNATSLALIAGLMLSGCAWLPAAGPTVGAVVDGARMNNVQRYMVVNVNDQVIDTLGRRTMPTFQSAFGEDRVPPAPTIAVGDTVAISIWEAGGASLFASTAAIASMETGSRQVSLPEQMVMNDGTVSVPFAKPVPAVGKVAGQLEAAIRNSLSGKAIDPQVIVAVTKSAANTATVTGQVVNGARIPLSPRGDRILDLIATAGGLKTPVYEAYVRLTRDGVTSTIPFSVLLNTPKENIYVHPGDILTVVHRTQNFVAFGASGRNAEIPFDEENLNMSQALSKAAGLLDDRADASGVFLLRYEPKPLASMLTSADLGSGNPVVPVVYQFDMKDIKSYFLAQRFDVQDKDIIYIASARANSLQKFFGLLGSLTNPIVTGAVISSSVH